MSTSFIDELHDGAAPALVPITVDQFHQMFQSGILREGDPIELIDGLLVRKDRSSRGEDVMTHNPRHALLIVRLQRLLTAACDAIGCHVRIQLPVTLGPTREPEPDVAVVRGSEDDYADRHPGGEDLTIVVEVSDSSLGVDRSTKQRLYATAGIPQYWIVNLQDSIVEDYEQPDADSGKYMRHVDLSPGETLVWRASATHRLGINVQDLLR